MEENGIEGMVEVIHEQKDLLVLASISSLVLFGSRVCVRAKAMLKEVALTNVFR